MRDRANGKKNRKEKKERKKERHYFVDQIGRYQADHLLISGEPKIHALLFQPHCKFLTKTKF